jgi:toxin ParE1/3/4
MRYDVVITDNAERDLEAIRDYIAANDSPADADRILDVLLGVLETLEQTPERGSHPRELLALGRKEYRQIIHNPWRVFYRVIEKRVYIVLIADGRRDMRTLLAQRLLGA